MPLNNTLTGWVDGAPPNRDDGGLVIVELKPEVQVDGLPHFSLPIIASRWSAKLRATGAGARISYDAVNRYIDITA